MRLADSDLDAAATAAVLSGSARVHLVGVGGAGMAPLAVLLAQAGHRVSGSDLRDGAALDEVRAAGVSVHVGQAPEQVHGASLVVTSTAVPATNVALVEARRLGIPVVHRGRVLGALTTGVASLVVAGTHGKTSTTTMLVTALSAAALDHGAPMPGWYIGAVPKGLPAAARWPDPGGWFVVEGDESDGTLLELSAQAAVVTNVEPDHLDHWGGVEGLHEGMRRFVASVPGTVVLCADDPVADALARGRTDAGATVLRYALVDTDVTATAGPGDHAGVVPSGDGDGDVTVTGRGLQVDGAGQHVEVQLPGHAPVSVQLPVRGRHMAANAVGAMAAAVVACGVPPATAARALGGFAGVERRFDIRHRVGGITLVDDYAHLPTEIRATLAATRSTMDADGWRRVVAVFQPNRPNRMVLLSPAYRDAFVDADVVVVADVYLSGEAPIAGVSGGLVVDAVRQAHPQLPVVYEPDRSRLAAVVAPLLQAGDVVVGMGCGDVASLPDELAPLLEPAPRRGSPT